MPLPILNLKKHPDYKKPPKEVFCLEETRLISTLGASAIIAAKTPTLIPWQLWEAAAMAGCVDYKPEMAEAMLEALESAAEAVDPSDPADMIRSAVHDVMLSGDTSAFKEDGTPKLVAVEAYLAQAKADIGYTADIPLDSEIVYDVFLGLQDVKPADPEPEPLPAADLEGEDKGGGSVWDMLGRVGPTEDY